VGRTASRPLTAQSMKSKSEPGLYCDAACSGLYLQISTFDTKSWLFRYMLAGRARKMGLGPASTKEGDGRITLKEARDLAAGARKLLTQGIDPIAERDARKAALAVETARATTFKECADDYIEAHRHEWKSAKHGGQWSATLETYAYPVVGSLPVGAIDTGLVVKILAPIWKTKAETARRVRSRIEKVLDRGAALKLRSGDNPARMTGQLKELLGGQVKVVKHHAALPYRNVPDFMTKLRQREGISARALEWTVLTAARTGDTIGAKWSEIDLAERTWTIPAARLKGQLGKRKTDHTVPLSDRALAILADLPRTGDFLFPGGKVGGLSNMAMAEVLKEMELAVTVHGFRSSFRDWGAEQTAYPNELLEMALAHVVGNKVEAAYRRGDMREKRGRLMADWAVFCDGKTVGGDNIVTIGGRK
jgi:integrase